MSEIIGIDVSQWQGVMDWDKAKAAGAQFAYIRAAFGSHKDTQFDRNWAETKRVGIPRGAYGWVINGVNQQVNAQRFKNFVGDDIGELPPTCDFEKYQSSGEWKYPTFGELRTFVERVELLFGVVPFIYSSRGYWTSLQNHATQTWAVKCPYWHAQYTKATIPNIPAPFPTWKLWQFSADGNGRGAEFGAKSSAIDINRFNGDIVDFEKFIGGDVYDPNDPPKDEYVRVVNCEWLSFRNRPEVYPGDRPAISPRMAQPAKVLKRENGWLYVELSGGDRGWIYEAYTRRV